MIKSAAAPRSIDLVDVPSPRPLADQVVVRVIASGICSTDAAIYDWTYRGRQPVPIPCILGHEATGEVVSTGANHSLEVGDRVAIEAVIPCLTCGVCRRGLTNICPNWRHLGASDVGGTFAEFIALPARSLHRLPRGLDSEDAALIEPLSVAVHGLSLVEHGVGEPLVVVGPGPLGLSFAMLGMAAGMSPVVVVGLAGIDEARLKIAEAIGARTLSASSAEEAVTQVREYCDPEGRGVFVESGGSAAALETVLDAATPGSDVLMVGFPIETTIKPFSQILRKGLRLQAVGASRAEHFVAAIAAIKGGIRTRRIISHRVRLAELDKGMELVLSRAASKVLVEI